MQTTNFLLVTLRIRLRRVDPGRLGKSVGFLSFDEMRRVDAALRIVLDL
jgi:hypothetical protein